MAQEEAHPVVLYVYDLSQGLARQLSTTLLGRAIEGIWHTSVRIYGLEYYYSGGIVSSAPEQTPYGRPVNVIELGKTQVPKEVFEEFLKEISPRYTAETYSLLSHNCNNFSNEVAQFLLGVEIPSYILRLPQDVMSSPMGALLQPMIEQMETTLRYGGVPQIPRHVREPTKTITVEEGMRIVEERRKAREAAKRPAPSDSAAAATQKKSSMDDAKAKVHEEISREFAALMAAGGLRASEAAALAARRVMQRHGVNTGAAT